VLALIQYFYGLCMMRRKPQDLPPSLPLLLILVFASLLLGLPLAADYFGSLQTALFAGVVETVVALGLYALPLLLTGNQARYLQTVTALFGIGLMITLLMVVLNLLASLAGDAQGFVPLELLLLGWAHAAFGHVWRHALDTNIFVGVGLALSFTVAGIAVVGSLFPVPVN